MSKNSRGKLSGAVRDETLAEVQQQEKEVSSRDKSAISPDTDAVPMRRWRTDSITEEASQYHPNRARSFNFQLLTEALGSQDPDFVWGLVSHISPRLRRAAKRLRGLTAQHGRTNCCPCRDAIVLFCGQCLTGVVLVLECARDGGQFAGWE